MKTRINQILLFTLFTFFLLAGNVNAEGTERKIASSLELIIEPALEIEAWMLDENSWVKSDFDNVVFEDAINLEGWMIDDTFFNKTTIEENNETEAELEIEPWMVDVNLWDLK